ncbi:MAG: nicotinamide-nucleotide amidohydrolase family protein [Salinibacterium sp.]|nr:nicotinamide-nucleotide amidohydrolase family protein [Salinibacterium sp.]
MEPEASLSSGIIALLIESGRTIAVAESLTGGLLVAELIRSPGASAAVLGGVVAYSTELKHTLLGVESELLERVGAVHADVACQMAAGVRLALAVGGRPADIGIATTGVAGPDPQDDQPVGTVFVGFAVGTAVHATRLDLAGGRQDIRQAVVSESLRELARLIS